MPDMGMTEIRHGAVSALWILFNHIKVMLYVLQKFSGDYSIVIVAVQEVCVEHIGDEETKFRANCPGPLNRMLKSNQGSGIPCREGIALAPEPQPMSSTDSTFVRVRRSTSTDHSP